MKRKKYKVVEEKGIPCPRCKVEMQVREHIAISEKQLNQPFYYSKWFCCVNSDCQTTLFMSDEFKVWNNNSKARRMKEWEEQREKENYVLSL